VEEGFAEPVEGLDDGEAADAVAVVEEFELTAVDVLGGGEAGEAEAGLAAFCVAGDGKGEAGSGTLARGLGSGEGDGFGDGRVGGGSGGPLLNVSLDAAGGLIATGARTSSAVDDAVLSSKVYADGFLAVAPSNFSASEANLLADTVGLIRYNATSKLLEQSTSVSAGARVWTPLSPQALGGLTAGRVSYTTGASSISGTARTRMSVDRIDWC
jgi:hypothetical protein